MSQRHAGSKELNGSVTIRYAQELEMTTKPPDTVLNHRRVALDMLQLALRGTIAASLIGALAMAVIAFAAS